MTDGKYFYKKLFVFFLLIFSAAYMGRITVLALDLTSTNFIIKDPIIGTGGGYGTSTNFQLISAGDLLLTGIGSSASFQTRYGFLYYEDAVDATITFDIDTAADFSNDESTTPYSVALGTLSTSAVTRSDTSSVRMIVIEGETNSTAGMVVTVANTNGGNGMVSTSVPADNINSSTGTMSAGTENYGLCVATTGLTGFSRSTGYSSDTCALGSGTNGVQALTSSPTSILNSGGAALVGGHAEIVVNASISNVTPAHTDYTDALTFIATGTF